MEEVVLAVTIAECFYKKLAKLLLRKQQLRKQLLRRLHLQQQPSQERLDVLRKQLLKLHHLLKDFPCSN